MESFYIIFVIVIFVVYVSLCFLSLNKIFTFLSCFLTYFSYFILSFRFVDQLFLYNFLPPPYFLDLFFPVSHYIHYFIPFNYLSYHITGITSCSSVFFIKSAVIVPPTHLFIFSHLREAGQDLDLLPISKKQINGDFQEGWPI